MAPSATAVETTTSYISISTILDEKFPFLEDHHGGYYNELKPTPKGLIGEALRNRVESIDHETCEADEENTFFVADLGEVYRQHMRWKKNLPRVKPFYGMSTSCEYSSKY